MLRIDLRSLSDGPAEVRGSIPPDDPLFEGLDFVPARAVAVSGKVSEAGQGRYYWRGRLATAVRQPCRRCLEPVGAEVDVAVDLLFAADSVADEDAGIYRMAERAAWIDLGEAVREELILAVPEYVVCREDCRGLCARCGTDLNQGTCDCRPEPDSRLGALEALKGTLPDRGV